MDATNRTTALTVNDIDTTYAEQSLELLIGATEKFLAKAERINSADLALQDDDNPQPLPLGEEAIRAEETLEKATSLQSRMETTPPTTEDDSDKFESQVEELIKIAEDIGIKLPLPEALEDDDASP